MTVTVWLTLSESAVHARLKNPRLITQAIKDAELPAHSVSKDRSDMRHVRIKQADLDAWLESRPYEPRRSA